MKHTPGPWSYDGHGINSLAESHLGERIMKTCLDYNHNSPDRERAIADSNLTAAGPDMLEACRGALACFMSGDLTIDMAVRRLRKAIDKAEGKEQ